MEFIWTVKDWYFILDPIHFFTTSGRHFLGSVWLTCGIRGLIWLEFLILFHGHFSLPVHVAAVPPQWKIRSDLFCSRVKYLSTGRIFFFVFLPLFLFFSKFLLRLFPGHLHIFQVEWLGIDERKLQKCRVPLSDDVFAVVDVVTLGYYITLQFQQKSMSNVIKLWKFEIYSK